MILHNIALRDRAAEEGQGIGDGQGQSEGDGYRLQGAQGCGRYLCCPLCPSGETWVGRAPDLSTIQNRIWFTLRLGSNSRPSLQAAWNLHGPDAIAFEIVEQIDEEENAYIRDRVLKARLDHWLGVLGAIGI